MILADPKITRLMKALPPESRLYFKMLIMNSELQDWLLKPYLDAVSKFVEDNPNHIDGAFLPARYRHKIHNPLAVGAI